MALFYVVAGINHFVHPAMYVAIMPRVMPDSWFGPLVAISGICEALFGLLLIPPATRKKAAWLLIALLIAVFPANIQMAIDMSHRHDPNAWLAWLRLLLQPVLIWWAFSFTKHRASHADN